jgi:hypothetical protein
MLGAVLLVGTMAAPFLAGRIYTADDLGAFHIPVRLFYAASLAAGDSFDWMPQVYNGFYLLGEGQVGAYHPLHLAAYTWLPFRVAFCLEALASYPLMLVGMYLLLRRRLARCDAALFGALAFTFCGFNMLHFVHMNAVAVISHIPWAVLLIDLLVSATPQQRGRWAVLLAAVTASQLLLGYPQYVWFSLLIEAGYACWLLSAGRTSGVGNTLAWLAGAMACGAMLGGVQLLPTIDALMGSTRQGADVDFLATGSMHPLNLVQLVAPYLSASRVLGENTHELGIYLGAVPLLLAMRAVFDPTLSARMRRLVRFMLLVGFVALVLSFGRYTVMLWLQQWLPLVGRFRFSARYGLLFAFATSAIAAVGFARLWLRDAAMARDNGTALTRLTWGVVAVSVLAAFVGPMWLARDDVGQWWAIAFAPCCFCLAAWLIVRTHNTNRNTASRRILTIALVALTCVDLGVYGLSYGVYPASHTPQQFIASVYAPPGEIEGRLAADLIPFNSKVPRTGNAFLLRGWSRSDGYSGLVPTRQFDQRTVPALRVASVHWVLTTAGSRGISGLLPHDDQWQRVPDPLPRVRRVANVHVTDNAAADLSRIDVATTALVDRRVEYDPASTGTAHIVADRPGHIEIDTGGDGRQLLVVSESFHHGWGATVDGLRVEVIRTNGDFIGCGVDAGEHAVVFHFDPASRRYGMIVTLAGAVMMAGMCIGSAHGQRASLPEPTHA